MFEIKRLNSNLKKAVCTISAKAKSVALNLDWYHIKIQDICKQEHNNRHCESFGTSVRSPQVLKEKKREKNRQQNGGNVNLWRVQSLAQL